ncbi:MAG: VOC family protein [Verrucomicrobia bacterium]|nr:VOC family protein [Verrucomicrobiota bacterium]
MNDPQAGELRLLETALYLDDVGLEARFYQDLFELRLLSGTTGPDAVFAALEVPGQGVLLLFKKGANAQPVETAGGIIPPHGGEGRLHLAFAISADSYESWKTRLVARNIKIESEVRWPRGGRSLYFRDPEGNLVELATPELWSFTDSP